VTRPKLRDEMRKAFLAKGRFFRQVGYDRHEPVENSGATFDDMNNFIEILVKIMVKKQQEF